jgi:2-amino-4-hydroxy-6-hydroxymethyldihydropteridine diphosphokinase
MTATFLGLGSNMGDRERNLLQAASLIRNRYALIDHSSLYNTAPVGYGEQPDFLNMVVHIDSVDSSPNSLLTFVKGIETTMGRRKTFRWGPRSIDIDILYMEDVSIRTAELTIPHREMFNRFFVLVPLSELTESLLIDGRQVSVQRCIENLQKTAKQTPEKALSLFKSKSSYAING